MPFNWFKQSPPPPIIESGKVPGWVQLIVPIVFTIIVGLAALSFNGYKSHAKMIDESLQQEITRIKDIDIKHLEDTKVDNLTMQLMIKYQQKQIENIDEKMEEVSNTLKEIKIMIQEK